MKKSTIILALLILAAVLIYLPKVLKKPTQIEMEPTINQPTENQTEEIDEVQVQPVVLAAQSVSISNFSFSPTNLTVKKGTTVTWTNQDNIGHTVTVDGGAGPDSGLLSQGQSYSYAFNDVGTYAYHCAPHPNMRASVTVTE